MNKLFVLLLILVTTSFSAKKINDSLHVKKSVQIDSFLYIGEKPTLASPDSFLTIQTGSLQVRASSVDSILGLKSDTGHVHNHGVTTNYVPYADGPTSWGTSLIRNINGYVVLDECLRVDGELIANSTELCISSGLSTGKIVTGAGGSLTSLNKFYDNSGLELVCGTTSGYQSGIAMSARSFSGNPSEGVFIYTRSAARLNINGTGTLNIDVIDDAGVDVDKFLVHDASDNIDYRTGAEVLSDLSGDATETFGWNSQSLNNINILTATNANISSLSTNYLIYYNGSYIVSSSATEADITELTDGSTTTLHDHDGMYFTETELTNASTDLHLDSLQLADSLNLNYATANKFLIVNSNKSVATSDFNLPSSGSFPCTLKTVSTEQYGTIYYWLNYYQVTLLIPIITGISDETGFEIYGIPDSLEPDDDYFVPVPCGVTYDNGSITTVPVSADLYTQNNSIRFYYQGNAGGWTSSGVKGTYAWFYIIYTIS